MNKLIALISIAGILLLFSYLESCVHPPPDVCETTPIKLSVSSTPASARGNDGSIIALATGGKDFTYSLDGNNFQASGTFSKLNAGNYVVSVKNAAGCRTSQQISVQTGGDACAGVTVSVTATKTDPTAGKSNGTITAAASGATGFTYSLNGGAYQAGASFTNLAAGTYTLSAKSTYGCLGSAQITLVAPDPCAGVTITVTASKTDPASGQSNGSITATATGATGFTYSINGGAYQASGTFNNLAAGTYTITAKSGAGCTGMANVTLGTGTVDPCAGKTIVVSAVETDVVPCGTVANNGTITVTATGSTGFTYSLNTGAYQSSNVFGSLAAGAYTINVKDAAGCIKTATITVNTAAAGPLFTAVKTVLFANCAPCHTTGSSGGVSFATDCGIVSWWSRIQGATNAGTMPPGSPLSAADKTKITNWVNAGHGYSN